MVKQGQPLVATLPSGTSASNVQWFVSPSSAVHITSGNGQALVLFAHAGNYLITARYPGSDSVSTDSSTAPITVSDSVYAPPPTPASDTFSLAGDQVILTPIADSASNLVFFAQSGKAYPCFSSFLFAVSSGPQTGISINLSQAVSTGIGNCNGSTSPVSSYLFLINPQNPFPNGTYPLAVTLNGTVYQGSLTITGTDYTFDWNYNSGVIIQPHVIPK